MSLLNLLEPLIDGVVANTAQIGLAIACIAVALYWRKATSAASIVTSAGSTIVIAIALIGLLMLSGIVPRLNVDLAVQYATDAWEMLADLLPIATEAVS